jgi:hypothetical protein
MYMVVPRHTSRSLKNEIITGPKLPESFNVLVKELQGLGLRVDLVVDDSETIDAESMHRTTWPRRQNSPCGH